MNCEITYYKKFRELFNKLPERIKKTARENYRLWKKGINHPRLNFKKICKNTNTYSIRIGLGYRAIGVKADNIIIWYWIVSHEEYNKFIKMQT